MLHILLGIRDQRVRDEQGRRFCVSQGTSPCHHQATETDMCWPLRTTDYAALSCRTTSMAFVGEGGNV